MQIISLYDSSGFTAPYYLKKKKKTKVKKNPINLQLIRNSS